MSLQTAAAQLRSAFAAAWGATTPVAWENAELDPKPSGPWVALSVIPVAEDVAALGTQHWRVIGRVAVRIFVPAGEGEVRLWPLVDQAAAVFRGATVGAVTFRGEMQLAVLGQVDANGGDYQVTLTFPFYRDTTH